MDQKKIEQLGKLAKSTKELRETFEKKLESLHQENADKQNSTLNKWKENLSSALKEAQPIISLEEQQKIEQWVDDVFGKKQYNLLLQESDNPLIQVRNKLTTYGKRPLDAIGFSIFFLVFAIGCAITAFMVPGLFLLIIPAIALLAATMIIVASSGFFAPQFPPAVAQLLYLIEILQDPKHGVHEAILALSPQPPSGTANASTVGEVHPPVFTPGSQAQTKEEKYLSTPMFYEIKVDNPKDSNDRSLDVRVLEWNGDGLAAALDQQGEKNFISKLKTIITTHRINMFCLHLGKENSTDAREEILSNFQSAIFANFRGGILDSQTNKAGKTTLGSRFRTIDLGGENIHYTDIVYRYMNGSYQDYEKDKNSPGLSLNYFLFKSQENRRAQFNSCLTHKPTRSNPENHTLSSVPAEHMVIISPYLTNNPAQEEKTNPGTYGVFYKKCGAPAESAVKVPGKAINFETAELVEKPSGATKTLSM